MAIDTTNLVKFSKGSLAGYQAKVKAQEVNNNTVYITTDEGGIYLGTKRLGDYVKAADINALKALPNKSPDALYYAETENVLARWKPDDESQPNGKGNWIQINAAGLYDVKRDDPDGQERGSVITSIYTAFDSETGARILNYTTANMATSSEVSAIKTDLGNLITRVDTIQGDEKVEGSIVKAVVDAKTTLLGDGAIEGIDTIASVKAAAAQAQTDADAAGNAASTNAGDISGLKTQVGEGTVDARIAAAKNAVLGEENYAQTVKSAYEAAVAAQGTANTGVANAATAQGRADDAYALAETNQGDISGLKTTVEGHTTTIGELVAAVGQGGSVDEKIAALRKEILTDGTADDSILDAYDTIQEIATWLAGSEGEGGKTAAQIISDLNTHAGDISGLKGQVGTGTVDARIATAKTAILGEENYEGTVKGAYEAAATAKGAADTAQGRADEAYNLADGAKTQANTNKGDISTLKGQMGDGTVDARITAAKTALLGQADYTGTIKGAYEAAADANTAAGNAQTRADNAYTLADSANTQANTNKGDISTLKTEQAEILAWLTWGSF